ncbi:MAG: ATP-dependent zinc metalloprotease FtsH [Pirellulaceae bacterium]|nr:ATP-dependent zinc metalloprotease FtsH [Pirellulaceae bacterium]
MDNQQPSAGNKKSEEGTSRRGQFWPILLLIVVLSLLLSSFWSSFSVDRISYSFFVDQLEERNIQTLDVTGNSARGTFREPPPKPIEYTAAGEPIAQKLTDEVARYRKQFSVTLPPESGEWLRNQIEKQRPTADEKSSDATQGGPIVATFHDGDTMNFFFMAIWILLPLALLASLWIMYRRTQSQMMGGGGFFSGFSRSTAKRYEASDQQTTFNDVAGLEGVKADLQELVEFLKSPEKFHRLGGRIPKGVLLNGPPGTGKTLLARAVAGEAGVPFYSVNGSEFIQMFVGVGASRVRDLFQQAKEHSPAIIFVDEIDAVGRQRGAGLGGGHDEREQTLNQILSEMDGFAPSESVIVLAATNRPDVLDPALLRPGRFDRHVTVGRPTQKGRMEMFKVHTRDVPLDNDVDLERLAAVTIGLTGADIRNLVNEAALWAARNNKNRVSSGDFDYARDKVLMGAKREEVLNEAEKKKTAYHEAGHTLAAWFLKGAQRVHKVTIIPRGRALGVTQIVPTEDRVSASEHELQDQLVVLLAGRSAEKMIYDETTVGAENDLERATEMARRMITHWGMSPKLGPVSYKTSEEDPFLGREMHQQRKFSEHTQEMIDGEVSRVLHSASLRATELLSQRREELEAITRGLLEREELSETEIEELIGVSVHGAARQHLLTSSTDHTDTDANASQAALTASSSDAASANDPVAAQSLASQGRSPAPER